MMTRLLMIALLLFTAANPALSLTVYDKELLYKVRFGQAADVQLLLSKGADANQLNEVGMPLVSVAASRRDGQAVPILRALVAAKADIDQGGASRQYPIVLAARAGDKELMKFLLDEAYADFNVRDMNGQSPREIASYYGFSEIAEMIDAINDARASALKDMYSPERREQLVHDAIFHYCATSYLYFYFSTKQDPISAEEQQEMLELHKGQVTVAVNDLGQIFQINGQTIMPLGQEAGKRVAGQLEALISNRNRRKYGVGTPEDLEKRCEAITQDIVTKRIDFSVYEDITPPVEQ